MSILYILSNILQYRNFNVEILRFAQNDNSARVVILSEESNLYHMFFVLFRFLKQNINKVASFAS